MTIPQVVNRVAIIQPWPLPSIATVFLGSPEKLVGIPPAALGAAKAGLLGEIFPEYLKISTSFTDGSDVNMEELLKLKPDVVFVMAKNAKQKQMVKDAGLRPVAFSCQQLAVRQPEDLRRMDRSPWAGVPGICEIGQGQRIQQTDV
ncbi:MAG: hypothetical protein LKE28_06380 [Sphaerochaeta sp.]|nr:hypothetical protein [Sphaerochaeta sp.]